MLLVIACEVLIRRADAHGGRRTAFGDEIVAHQALGYRKFLGASRRASCSPGWRRTASIYRILPYAEAMGLGGSLPGRSATRRWSSANGTRAPKPVPRTAAGFYSACARRSL